ncbi:Kef-type K+ transport system, membrane component [Leptolyngbyaceae cyanobacterium JSC-12]|nr:Kef-type K+ transport system, membrane component [Leptolyngbyaceae cyanobacterium JSC-12]
MSWFSLLSTPGLYPTPWLQSLLATTSEAANAPLILAAVLLSLVIIFLASKLGGEICARIDLPPVLGELVGGVVVGISVLHLLVFPEGVSSVNESILMKLLDFTSTADQQSLTAIFEATSEVVSVLAEMGVVILLFEIGLESDLKELLKVGPQATVVAVVGVVTPFVLGTVGLTMVFGVPVVPAIFAGAALTATSIGITAKVLAEIQRLTSREGQIIIGAAVLDDVLGIIVLAVVASLAREGTVEITNVIYLIVSASVFLIGSIWLGRLLNPVFVAIVDGLKTRGQLLISALIVAFTLSYVADVIQLEAILGSFAAGLILAETDKRHDLQEQVIPIADMLVPVFFISVGAKTDVSVLNPFIPENREGLIMASFLILVAIVGKVITGFAVFGQPGINRLAIGVGMVPRGEVGLVFAAVGSTSGVLSASLNAAIIVMVILTTFLAPPLLRVVFQQGEEPDEITSIPADAIAAAPAESEEVQSETT